ncbi:MAG: acyloxyacyl hydrolase [Chitinophagaceae bacterium]|jgi:hypothetical protein|nr:acyloxyacyl hydrolase [Chitinophagaceae bacterium]
MKTCFVLLFFVFVANNCFAQNKDYVFGLNAQYGFVWVHTAQVESVRGTKPQSLSFSFVKQYTDEKTYQKWHFFARQGVQFTYTDFHQPATSVLGKAYILSYILQPIIPLNENLNLVFTGTFGGAYLTRPYNANTNPGNQSYSESLNARLGLSAGLEYNIGENYALNLSADYNHISNGGMKQPNRGINYPTASIGIVYHTNSNRLPKYQKVKDDSWKQDNGIKKDFSIFFSPKDGYAKIDPSQAYNTGAWKQQWKALIGGNIQFSKRVSGVNALNLGVETYYDGAVASIKNNRGYPSSNMFVGLLAGNEFIIGRFLFSQQLGWYLYKNTKYLDTTYYNQNNGTNIYATPFYQRYGIKYRFSDNWFAGFNLLAHGKTADFFDFRLTYRLGRVRFSAERFE